MSTRTPINTTHRTSKGPVSARREGPRDARPGEEDLAVATALVGYPAEVIDFGAAQRERELRRVTTAPAPGSSTPVGSGDSGGRRLGGRSFDRAAAPASGDGAADAYLHEAAPDARELRRSQHIARYEQKRARQQTRQQKAATRRTACPTAHPLLFVCSTFLAFVSLIFVYSASMPVALDSGKPAGYFLARQALFVVLGYAAFLAVSRLDRRHTRTLVWVLYAVALIGLLAIDFTPLGFTQSGVRRWIKLPFLPPQQFSELAKIALVGVMADFWSIAAVKSRDTAWPWFVTALLALPMVGLVFVQPHFSCALLLFVLPIFIAMYAGVPWRRLAGIVVPLALLGISTVVACKYHAMPFLKPYQQERIAAHLGGGGAEAAQGANYQKLQSERTIIGGGLFGRGLARSLGKQGHLPEPHTDFIFAVIGEECGLAGTLGLLILFGTLICLCFQIGSCAETGFESLLCGGIGTLLAFQVICNVAVATGTLPVTGMPLPFISYGGSGLVCMLIGVGMVLGVSRQTSRSALLAEAHNAAADALEAQQTRAALTLYRQNGAGVQGFSA